MPQNLENLFLIHVMDKALKYHSHNKINLMENLAKDLKKHFT